ncbi:hypothetical protein LTR91_019032 [Friedmanniomyces endolithicus]|uniref:Cytochrome b5 heme-binding domain-containing protein n=1 Tax=Friedmanniomyces endolithicus TaxID=329885 RepID=A0AAN6K1R1_9PEZI|nr:hypothetical protein LTR94_006362 [Friedmanniomyces endolithicus]KAK0782954.1 hypothetical protein LTR38_013188 [Friedmanniomyces endolithicus]KAK0812570.1 hypothetical protein LTR59_001531 [Friedmanniomyces endolithicus]KAK0815241.1 hypothetical protein LTR75_003910 [Friedmanniomyces endolithicus]KAK0871551.1 hypothetical protein LTS02_001890 [Friedmanniomyces endolithicus]
MSWSILPQWILPGKAAETPTESKPTNTIPNVSTKSQDYSVAAEDEGDREGTPKAEPARTAIDVPTFALSEVDDIEPISEPTSPPATSFPALNSAQRASSMAPPPKPAELPAKKPIAGLMAPPTRLPGVQRAPPPSSASSLRLPGTGPLPNRGPPIGSQQRISSSLSPNGTAVSVPNPRGKVLLSPGHSPMDWAALTRSGNLAGVPMFQRVTPSELKRMTGRKGKPAWSSWQGKVYNITPYLSFHPGGEAELMKAAGRDGAKLFMEVHPWVNWENMLGSCMVGVLVPEDYGVKGLEEID